MDYIRTAAGSEASDQSFRASSSKPNWFLTPLPLLQIRPDYELPASSGIKTLASCCLTAISQNLDKFSLSSFSTLPPHLIRRIVSRARDDRNYEHDTFEQVITHPDETTIWAISALNVPSETDHHILGLPSAHLLQHMYQHPLTTLPTYEIAPDPLSMSLEPPKFRFLTTLKLEPSDAIIDDRNIQSLKWCTHLTALWMISTSVTDYGITLLASALELPGDKGMCRLRAWSVARSKGITDKSMKAFAKFPGLVMLDLRETSCTDVAIDIFNRQSAALFPHPGFQPCTEGLRDLFASHKSTSDIVTYLCTTLLRIPEYIALNIVPTTTQMSARHTPFPASDMVASTSRPRPTGTYRADGVGAIYGKDVHSVADPIKDLRRAVNYLPQAWQKETDDLNGIVRKQVRSDWDWDGKPKFAKRSWGDEDKPKPKYFKVEEKRRRKEPEIKGDPKLMLVRMIEDGWEEMTWGTSVKARETPRDVGGSSNVRSSRIRTKSATAMVDDLINATSSSSQSRPFRPFQPPSSSPAPTSSPPAEIPSSRIKRPSLNPFRTSTSTPSSTGVRPLSQSQSQSQSPDEFGFTSSQNIKTKRFEGADIGEKKRAGMRMFTVK